MSDESLDSLLARTERIVFVCSGNMVRSAFAELYARHVGLPRELASVATTYRNDALYPETARALRALGLSEETLSSFRPTHVDDAPELFGPGTLLFAMTTGHLRALRTGPAAGRPGLLLPRVLGLDGEIPDPVLEGADFGETFRTVRGCVDALNRALRSGGGS